MRLIDGDKYKEDLWVGREYLDEDTLLTATNLLDSQPTIEVKDLVEYYMDELSRTIHCKVVESEPVRHGRWENKQGGFWEVGTCSVCGGKTPTVGANYCPNCGAKMDGDRHDQA